MSGTTIFTAPIIASGGVSISDSEAPVLHVQFIDINIGGAAGTVKPNIWADTTVTGAPDDYVWGNLSTLTYAGTGGTGQHVSLYGQSVRRTANHQSTTVTAALATPAPTIQVADITHFTSKASGPISANNQMVCQVGPNGSTYYLISAVASGAASGSAQPGSLTFSAPVNTWDAEAGAIVYAQDNPQLWAACLESRDMSGVSADQSGASQIVVEMDLLADGPDTHGRRQVMSIVLGRQNPTAGPAQFGGVMDVYYVGGSGAEGDSVATILNPFCPIREAAIELRNITGVSGGGIPTAIALQSGHVITLDQDQGRWIRWNPATSAIELQALGQPRLSVLDNGLTQLTPFTVQTLPQGPAGSLAFVSNARKPNEQPGAGTGVLAFFDGHNWISVLSGTVVEA